MVKWPKTGGKLAVLNCQRQIVTNPKKRYSFIGRNIIIQLSIFIKQAKSVDYVTIKCCD